MINDFHENCTSTMNAEICVKIGVTSQAQLATIH